MDYRSQLKEYMAKSYSVAKLAEETRIQRTFLSQVFQLKKHLSSDQIYLVAEALDLSPATEQRLQELADWEKCEHPERKMALEKKLKGQMDESNRVKGVQPEAWDDFITDPHAEVIYNYLQIESFNKDPKSIRDRLSINENRWEEALSTLKSCDLVYELGSRIIPKHRPYAVEDGTPEASLRHVNARLRVSEQKLKQRNIDDFLYNWWIIGNDEAKKELKIAYLNLIARIYEESKTVQAEDVYQLSIDLFSPQT